MSHTYFKFATEQWEFEQIHRLNYKAFVEELPQHFPNPEKILVDRFHEENTYIVCVSNNTIIGMLAVRGERPFSLDQKLENLESYLPPNCSLCEFRLFFIEKASRGRLIARGLFREVRAYCIDMGYELALISGTLSQLKLYKHLGFVPFGPIVGAPAARFQPMYLTPNALSDKTDRALRKPCQDLCHGPLPVNLLPGPVDASEETWLGLKRHPTSHRSEVFHQELSATKRLLCRLTGARSVEIFCGSGTLANDVVAGQLSLLRAPGLILSNGEFGERLVGQAKRFEMSFQTLSVDWGRSFNPTDLRDLLDQQPRTKWIWAVHCETSTGILNDIERLKEICAQRHLHLCMDCISSIGTTPVDLSGIYLASGVSGKGIGSFTGLAFVFYQHDATPAPKSLPVYLDLGYYAAKKGVPFTLSSNLLYALQAALQDSGSERAMGDLAHEAVWLRAQLRRMGFSFLGRDETASSAIVTIALPKEVNVLELGQSLDNQGYLLSYRSSYLVARNWIQISLMSKPARADLSKLLEIIQRTAGLAE